MTIKFIKTTDIGNHKIKGGTTELQGFKKLNIFVGKNNSGKSRFLRHLINKRVHLIDQQNNDLQKNVADLYYALVTAYPHVVDREEFLIKTLGDISRLESQEISKELKKLKLKTEKLKDQNGDTSSGNASVKNIAKTIHDFLMNKNFIEQNDKVIYVYIPILRGLRPLVKDDSALVEVYTNEDCYKNRTQFDYFTTKLDDNVVIFSGLDLYQQIKRMLLGTREQRDFVKSFEKFLSQHFFNDKEVVLTPTIDKDVLSISIDGIERFIHEVGDGIQAIICNTFLAFVNKDKDLVLFIEEPEIFLHPGMQRTLMEVLIKELKNVQIFLTTHSNHFLDLIYDYEDEVAVYSFQKEEDDFYITNITKNREVIDILGVRNSSIYLANCVVWVEGVSDRIYLKKFLDLYSKEKNIRFNEDYHFAIAEYGGGNIENFDFIDSEENNEKVRVVSISKNNLIIADNDGNKDVSNKKGERLKKLEELLGENFYDDYIEIENLIPYKVYSSILTKILPANSKKAIKIKDPTQGAEIKFNEKLGNERIGDLLKKYFIENKEDIEPEYFKNKSIDCLGETKKSLADIITKEIDISGIKFSELPKQAQVFTEKVISFIQKNNEIK